MNTMYRCALAAIVVVAAVHTSAQAQSVRNFPPGTLRGVAVFGDFPAVTVNGQATQLTPGSRVRGADNLVVMPPAVAGLKLLVHYTVDPSSNYVKDVWILTAPEAAIKPWPHTLDEARTWLYNPTTQSWTQP